MCTIMKKTKELLKIYERHQDPRKSGNLEKKKKKDSCTFETSGKAMRYLRSEISMLQYSE